MHSNLSSKSKYYSKFDYYNSNVKQNKKIKKKYTELKESAILQISLQKNELAQEMELQDIQRNWKHHI